MMVTWETEESRVLCMLHGSSFAGSLKFLVYKFNTNLLESYKKGARLWIHIRWIQIQPFRNIANIEKSYHEFHKKRSVFKSMLWNSKCLHWSDSMTAKILSKEEKRKSFKSLDDNYEAGRNFVYFQSKPITCSIFQKEFYNSFQTESFIAFP